MVRRISGGHSGEGWGTVGEAGMGMGFHEKVARAIVKTSSKGGGVLGEYGSSLLRSSGWNSHQNAVLRLSLVRKRAWVIILLRARNCS